MLDDIVDEFEAACRNDGMPDIRSWLTRVDSSQRKELFQELLIVELFYCRKAGRVVAELDYQRQFPDYHSQIANAFLQDAMDRKTESMDQHSPSILKDAYRTTPSNELPATQERKSGQRLEPDFASQSKRIGPYKLLQPIGDPQATAGDKNASTPPEQIGRYRIERVLGKGGFGLVYLARDEQLRRMVAIKVPHPHLVAEASQAEAYLTEARTVAGLDHPNIVPVYDVGSTDQYPYFVVSKYVDGTDLATKLRHTRFAIHETVELLATVAEALHYAHKKGLVHRDIKPENILLDQEGHSFVADFGLALREQDIGKGARYVGTPAYMSPEQSRGEGHRVDGRCDIFSLGVVFYQMLTGRRPFRADSQLELLDQICRVEVRPPRQVDDQIPRELERICLKSLSKRASERHTTALDFADDLRCFLAKTPSVVQSTAIDDPSRTPASATPFATHDATPLPTPITMFTSDSRPIKIVPKGLRSFDAHDADFFLELLPGARDRDGLPDSIRFWKNSIEQTDANQTFSVGMIYGPSGCGKSSLVKAGLLPRLSKEVIVVYIEATAEETETRLLKGLRKRVPELPSNLGLKETFAILRRGHGIPLGKKIVVVLDQFEQWLHAKKEELTTELVEALRHCDGSRIQCVVMVRDDFWMSATRFMRELEVRLVEAQNSAAVDLFPIRHAENVLAAFGRAFGVLPIKVTDTTSDQQAFVNQAVTGLAQEGKVISVRLSLFAEMMKGKSWTAASLKAVGGTEGVGVTFLEEAFSASTAPPEHRYHQQAAKNVLRTLLPDSGKNIKGHRQSRDALAAASGYQDRPRDFSDLLSILDSELRLITPADQESLDASSSSEAKLNVEVAPLRTDRQFYQLTHDYLVQPLRDWLARKQKETRRGRAELLLEDRTLIWRTKREKQQLPSVLQWLGIRWWVPRKSWSEPQARMMQAADRLYLATAALTLAIGVIAAWGGREWNGRTQSKALFARLSDARTTEVPKVVEAMTGYYPWLASSLLEGLENGTEKGDYRRQVNLRLALLPIDQSHVEPLGELMLSADPDTLVVIRNALAGFGERFRDRLWEKVEDSDNTKRLRRLRAAAALASFDPNSNRWKNSIHRVADDLVRTPSLNWPTWMAALRPLRSELKGPLLEIFGDRTRSELERTFAFELLREYNAEAAEFTVRILLEADAKNFASMFLRLEQTTQELPFLMQLIEKEMVDRPIDPSEANRSRRITRVVNAAVACVRLERGEKVWPLLRRGPNLSIRSKLIESFSRLGVEAKVLIDRLDIERDNGIRQALVLSLGAYSLDQLPKNARQSLIANLRQTFLKADDVGVHSATEWLMRQWGDTEWIAATVHKQTVENRLSSGNEDRLSGEDRSRVTRHWFVNSQGQTMVTIPGPVEFKMGSRAEEEGRFENEVQHRRRIDRSFAIASKPVTVEEFRRFRQSYEVDIGVFPTSDCPAGGVTFYQAASYCNWLSQLEKLPKEQWCFEFGDSGISLKPGYLGLQGYRLPTEAEWEYAARAGTETSWFWGETPELISQYSWTAKNSQMRCWPVGSLMPNEFGLFDVAGNVFDWCMESNRAYQVSADDLAVNDVEEPEAIGDIPRSQRGASYLSLPKYARHAFRRSNGLYNRNETNGFRIAKTYVLDSREGDSVTK